MGLIVASTPRKTLNCTHPLDLEVLGPERLLDLLVGPGGLRRRRPEPVQDVPDRELLHGDYLSIACRQLSANCPSGAPHNVSQHIFAYCHGTEDFIAPRYDRENVTKPYRTRADPPAHAASQLRTRTAHGHGTRPRDTRTTPAPRRKRSTTS